MQLCKNVIARFLLFYKAFADCSDQYETWKTSSKAPRTTMMQMLANRRVFSLSLEVLPRPHTGDEITRLPFICGCCGKKEPEQAHKATAMHIHIGIVIRDEMRRQGHKNEWLADRIGVNIRTVNKIYLKETIDTQQLYNISKALETDFFSLYSKEL